jgi:hypothetical protein
MLVVEVVETEKIINEQHDEEIAEQHHEQSDHLEKKLTYEEILTKFRMVHAINEAEGIVTAKQIVLERASDLVKESIEASPITENKFATTKEKYEDSNNDDHPIHAANEEHKIVDNHEGESDMKTIDSVITDSYSRKFPSIVKQLEGLAAEQCDLLAEYIRDKVYRRRRLHAFCGMRRHVGCSTMALTAAKTITRYGLKTALIDANFDYPHLGTACPKKQLPENALEFEACWTDVLQGKTGWESLGFSPENIVLLRIFPLRENVLASWTDYQLEFLQQAVNRFITTLHEHFDLILLDCGAFEPPDEEITWGEIELFQPDSVILVRNPNQTSAEDMEPFYQEMTVGGIEEIGIAENFA